MSHQADRQHKSDKKPTSPRYGGSSPNSQLRNRQGKVKSTANTKENKSKVLIGEENDKNSTLVTINVEGLIKTRQNKNHKKKSKMPKKG